MSYLCFCVQPDLKDGYVKAQAHESRICRPGIVENQERANMGLTRASWRYQEAMCMHLYQSKTLAPNITQHGVLMV